MLANFLKNSVETSISKIKNDYIANLVIENNNMENDFRDKQRNSFRVMRMIYDLTMAFLLLAMAVMMLFGEKMKIEFIASIDSLFRYMFGSICLLYGGFRLYRGIKREY